MSQGAAASRVQKLAVFPVFISVYNIHETVGGACSENIALWLPRGNVLFFAPQRTSRRRSGRAPWREDKTGIS